MSLRVDRVQLEIIINNDQARKQMRLLDEELKQAYKDLRKLPKVLKSGSGKVQILPGLRRNWKTSSGKSASRA